MKTMECWSLRVNVHVTMPDITWKMINVNVELLRRLKPSTAWRRSTPITGSVSLSAPAATTPSTWSAICPTTTSANALKTLFPTDKSRTKKTTPTKLASAKTATCPPKMALIASLNPLLTCLMLVLEMTKLVHLLR